ncbi:hypothetical protein GDO78_014165 [Eleutherodactylus coqui]|uniref:Uncharacterized protein n=1 Tax=Eleutherodactylus coqui TaxID=57060 RepID=A0A8J6JQF8_ELECQ|nr:hypothetical protein GDO78_014165 [Eleutherodactylus coqui]
MGVRSLLNGCFVGAFTLLSSWQGSDCSRRQAEREFFPTPGRCFGDFTSCIWGHLINLFPEM